MVDQLYELIGGRPTIVKATDRFYEKVLEDEELRHFFKRTDMAHLRALQSMFISMLLGGRVVYTGKDIHDAHSWARNHGLSHKHFDLFLKHFSAALAEVGVQPEKVEKVMKLLELKRDIVLHHQP